MKFYHVTSAIVAKRLLNQPIFEATKDVTSAGGIHGYTFKRGYFLDQQTLHRGVKLVLKWTGDVEFRPLHQPGEYKNNVLYVQYPWRCFIKGNSGQNNLQILGVLDDHSGELKHQLGLNLTRGWLSAQDYQAYIKAKSQQFLRQYWQTCNEKPVYLNVPDMQPKVCQESEKLDNRAVSSYVYPPMSDDTEFDWTEIPLLSAFR